MSRCSIKGIQPLTLQSEVQLVPVTLIGRLDPEHKRGWMYIRGFFQCLSMPAVFNLSSTHLLGDEVAFVFTEMSRKYVNFLEARQFINLLKLTHCNVALLRKVDRFRCKELGRRTGRRSYPMEQTPQTMLVPWKWWGNIISLEDSCY